MELSEQSAGMKQIVPERLDDFAYVICLEVPGEKVVSLQAYFELCEGLGVVRTLDAERSLVCVFTTPGMLQDCLKLLEALREPLQLKAAARSEDLQLDSFVG